MLPASLKLTDTEEKEVLKKESESLHMFVAECKELLHIKEVCIDVEQFKREYVRTHCNLNKFELITRLSIIDELLEYIRNSN